MIPSLEHRQWTTVVAALKRRRGLQGWQINSLPLSDRYMRDLGDPASMKVALQGIDKLFLLSSIASHFDRLEIGAIKAAQDAGVKHVVAVRAAAPIPRTPC